MKIYRTNHFKFFSTTASILLVFLAFRSYQLVYSLIHLDDNLSIILGRSLSLIAVLILSYLTYKRKNLAAWAMVFFLVLSGFSIFSFGIFAVHTSQLALKTISIIFGAYFFYGGIIIFRSIRKGEMNNPNTLKTKA
jgi:hypothetical protein